MVANSSSTTGFLSYYQTLASAAGQASETGQLERLVFMKPPPGFGFGATLASGRSVSPWGEPVEMLESDANACEVPPAGPGSDEEGERAPARPTASRRQSPLCRRRSLRRSFRLPAWRLRRRNRR